MDQQTDASGKDLELQGLRRELEATRARQQRLYEEAPVGYCDVDPEGRIVRANACAQDLLGVAGEALIGRPVSDFVASDDQELCQSRHSQTLQGAVVPTFDLRMVKHSGDPFWARIKAREEQFEDGTRGCRMVLTDVSRLRRAEDEVRQLARAVQQSPASIVITDRNGDIAYVNDYFEHATGYTRAEVLGKNPRVLKSGKTPPEVYAELWRVITDGREWVGELCNRRKDGALYWEHAAISGLKNETGEVSHFIAVKYDVSDRKRMEDNLRTSLHEKEALLQETHHRVKNNLALITSLMRITAGQSREAETKAVLKEMQERIHSVLLLNETLYKTQSYTSVKLAEYVKQIATHVFQAQNSNAGEVRLVLDLDGVEVATGQAIPCGLIVNELMTNSLKHAFPGGRGGEVRVSLKSWEGKVRLALSDTGVGLPADFATKQRDSLGMQLVGDLARQLAGALEVGPGAAFVITFGHWLDS